MSRCTSYSNREQRLRIGEEGGVGSNGGLEQGGCGGRGQERTGGW